MNEFQRNFVGVFAILKDHNALTRKRIFAENRYFLVIKYEFTKYLNAKNSKSVWSISLKFGTYERHDSS